MSISEENRHRPRRSGYLVDHLPNVIGWNFDTTMFCPDSGQDWTQSADDPACAMGVTWEELGVRPNVKTRLECNRWLEGGRRIEDWLPDLPTTHHFDFEPCREKPSIEFKRPSVVVHMAGWPDVPDEVWAQAVDLFRDVAHVYLVGGSYDRRPRTVYEQCKRRGVTLMEDVGWADLLGVLKACDYCFGHASGFTAMADVLKVRGAVFNPRSVPCLIGSWNSPENKGMVHVDRVPAFEGAIYQAYEALSGPDRATWPPTFPRGPRLAAERYRSIPYAVAKQQKPRRIAVYTPDDAHPGFAADTMSGVYDAGGNLEAAVLVGCHRDAHKEAQREAARSSRRPHLVTVEPDAVAGGLGALSSHLAVVVVPFAPGRASDMVRSAWRGLAAQGTLLVGGPAAASAAESLGSTLGVEPVTVEGSGGEWWYIHRAV